MTTTDQTPGAAPTPLRARLLAVLRTAPRPLSTDEIRQRLDLPGGKPALTRLHHELNRLYIGRLVEVERRADPARRKSMWRAVGLSDGAR